MEIIFVVVAVVVVFVVKMMSGLSAGATAKEAKQFKKVLQEQFPEVEVLEKAEEYKIPVPNKETVKPQPVKKKSTPLQATRSEGERAVPQAPVVKKEEKKKRDGYALKNKSDIKKAIISAEIFNKKYN